VGDDVRLPDDLRAARRFEGSGQTHR
jgi:hypothetical protein